ncbi:hypothetical protein Scep_030467 [Stephania cephalantha]|uniref:Uncharacterized protein n=1 Tax=Stephania cephalantha TaxID=152367 RepID=A0AAP0DZT6_9MAGN
MLPSVTTTMEHIVEAPMNEALQLEPSMSVHPPTHLKHEDFEVNQAIPTISTEPTTLVDVTAEPALFAPTAAATTHTDVAEDDSAQTKDEPLQQLCSSMVMRLRPLLFDYFLDCITI